MLMAKKSDPVEEALTRLGAVIESAESQLREIKCPFDVYVELASPEFPKGSRLWWTKRAGQWRICVQFPDRDENNDTESIAAIRVPQRLEAVARFRQLRDAVINKKSEAVSIINKAADEFESVIQENEL